MNFESAISDAAKLKEFCVKANFGTFKLVAKNLIQTVDTLRQDFRQKADIPVMTYLDHLEAAQAHFVKLAKIVTEHCSVLDSMQPEQSSACVDRLRQTIEEWFLLKWCPAVDVDQVRNLTRILNERDKHLSILKARCESLQTDALNSVIFESRHSDHTKLLIKAAECEVEVEKANSELQRLQTLYDQDTAKANAELERLQLRLQDATNELQLSASDAKRLRKANKTADKKNAKLEDELRRSLKSHSEQLSKCTQSQTKQFLLTLRPVVAQNLRGLIHQWRRNSIYICLVERLPSFTEGTKVPIHLRNWFIQSQTAKLNTLQKENSKLLKDLSYRTFKIDQLRAQIGHYQTLVKSHIANTDKVRQKLCQFETETKELRNVCNVMQLNAQHFI